MLTPSTRVPRNDPHPPPTHTDCGCTQPNASPRDRSADLRIEIAHATWAAEAQAGQGGTAQPPRSAHAWTSIACSTGRVADAAPCMNIACHPMPMLHPQFSQLLCRPAAPWACMSGPSHHITPCRARGIFTIPLACTSSVELQVGTLTKRRCDHTNLRTHALPHDMAATRSCQLFLACFASCLPLGACSNRPKKLMRTAPLCRPCAGTSQAWDTAAPNFPSTPPNPFPQPSPSLFPTACLALADQGELGRNSLAQRLQLPAASPVAATGPHRGQVTRANAPQPLLLSLQLTHDPLPAARPQQHLLLLVPNQRCCPD